MIKNDNPPKKQKYIPASVIIFLREHRRKRLAREAREREKEQAHNGKK